MNPRPVVLYDSGCRFCRFAVRTVALLDRRRSLSLLPLQADEAIPLLGNLPEDERLSSLRLAQPDGTLLSRGAAVTAVLARLGLPHPPSGSSIGEGMYGFVAGHRRAIGRFVPDGPAPRRYP